MYDDRSETAPKRLAILPWGDLIEDYLDPVGLTLDEMCRDMIGGWLFGTVEALQRVGVECVLFVITARLEQARSLRHEPTGMLVRALPCRPAYRGIRRFVANPYGQSGAEMFGVSRRWKVTLAELQWPIVPYFNTPLGPLGRDLRRHGCTAILCQDYEHARFDLAVILGARLGLPVIASYQGGDRPFSGLEGAICRRSLKRVGGLILRACREAERVAPLSAKRLEELADDRIIQIDRLVTGRALMRCTHPAAGLRVLLSRHLGVAAARRETRAFGCSAALPGQDL